MKMDNLKAFLLTSTRDPDSAPRSFPGDRVLAGDDKADDNYLYFVLGRVVVE